jgi:hypothetical protein
MTMQGKAGILVAVCVLAVALVATALVVFVVEPQAEPPAGGTTVSTTGMTTTTTTSNAPTNQPPRPYKLAIGHEGVEHVAPYYGRLGAYSINSPTPPPANQLLLWELFDAQGSLLETGGGPTWFPEFHKPGAYTVRLSAWDGSRLYASTNQTVVVHPLGQTKQKTCALDSDPTCELAVSFDVEPTTDSIGGRIFVAGEYPPQPPRAKLFDPKGAEKHIQDEGGGLWSFQLESAQAVPGRWTVKAEIEGRAKEVVTRVWQSSKEITAPLPPLKWTDEIATAVRPWGGTPFVYPEVWGADQYLSAGDTAKLSVHNVILPGFSIRWEVVGEGTRVNGTGKEFEFEVPRPGVYFATATVINATGQVISERTERIPVNDIMRYEDGGACPQTVGTRAQCEPFAFYMPRSGVALDLFVELPGPDPFAVRPGSLPRGDMIIRDASGNEVARSPPGFLALHGGGLAFGLELAPLEGFVPGEWTATIELEETGPTKISFWAMRALAVHRDLEPWPEEFRS